MANTNSTNLAQDLDDYLVTNGVSRLAFAKEAGISHETLRAFLDTGSNPYPRTLHKIKKALSEKVTTNPTEIVIDGATYVLKGIEDKDE